MATRQPQTVQPQGSHHAQQLSDYLSDFPVDRPCCSAAIMEIVFDAGDGVLSPAVSDKSRSIFVAWHQSEPLPLELLLISDSEHLLAKRFLEEVSEQAADGFQNEHEEIEVFYDD